MRGARCEQRFLVREVAVDGGAADAGLLSDRRDRRLGRADAFVECDRTFGDAKARLRLELCAALHPVWTLLIGHRCSLNIDRSVRTCNRFRKTLPSNEKEPP